MELDRIFKRIYEDDISGAISQERFLKLSGEYEADQKELTAFAKFEQTAVNTYEQDKADFDSFAAIIRKYVGITELTPTIVNEFVKKIIVRVADIAAKSWKSFGPLSGNWSRTRTRRRLNGKEKTRRHSLLTLPPCNY